MSDSNSILNVASAKAFSVRNAVRRHWYQRFKLPIHVIAIWFSEILLVYMDIYTKKNNGPDERRDDRSKKSEICWFTGQSTTICEKVGQTDKQEAISWIQPDALTKGSFLQNWRKKQNKTKNICRKLYCCLLYVCRLLMFDKKSWAVHSVCSCRGQHKQKLRAIICCRSEWPKCCSKILGIRTLIFTEVKAFLQE